MRNILMPNQMRKVERRAMDAGTPGIDLMERAAAHVARRVLEMAGGGEVLFLCGVGNNGGDGFAAARLLAMMGGRVQVALVGGREGMSRDTMLNARRILSMGLPLDTEFAVARPALIVDALYGTGLTRAPTGDMVSAIEWINNANAKVLSVDLPSGVDARDGSTPGAAVRADVTLAFHALKVGNALFPGRALCGKTEVCDIGIDARASSDAIEHLEREDVACLLAPRAMDAHKGTFGRLLIVAGSRGMAGAAALCARGALCAGAGLTQIAATKDVMPVVQVLAPEATAVLLPEEEGAVAPRCDRALAGVLAGKDAVAVGPGMTAGEGTFAAVRSCLAACIPCVIDADGLNVLAEDLELLERDGPPPVLTPHPGEMARLMGRPVDNPLEDAMLFACEHRVVLLLKGASTIIASPDGRTSVNLSGTPAMARGGSGDVLTGAIAALLAQGLEPYEAARLGAYIHGLAGEEAQLRRGLAMTAMDLPGLFFV